MPDLRRAVGYRSAGRKSSLRIQKPESYAKSKKRAIGQNSGLFSREAGKKSALPPKKRVVFRETTPKFRPMCKKTAFRKPTLPGIIIFARCGKRVTGRGCTRRPARSGRSWSAIGIRHAAGWCTPAQSRTQVSQVKLIHTPCPLCSDFGWSKRPSTTLRSR